MAQRLIIQNLSLQYSASEPKALSSLSLEVPAGSCCAILGPTGSGKSTLLHCLAGTMRRHHPESIATGQIQIGEEIYRGLPEQILFPVAGLVLQDPYVQISGVRDTVYDEILFTLENLGTMPEQSRQVIESLLKGLGVDHLTKRKPTSLSGGETQRVALAAMMIAQPHLLLLDEPTTALDSNAQGKLRLILRSLMGKTTILLTDAQIDFTLAVADLFVVLNAGTIVFQGNRQALMGQLKDLASLLPVESWLRAHEHLLSTGLTAGRRQLISKTLGLP
jgi:energy-coupling factor transporter ATP-binding protein EcfA2